MSQKLNRFYRYLELYEKLVITNAGNFVDHGLAEDVSQETFEKMYQHLDYLDDDGVKGWLLVVSANIAKDYLKKGGSIDVHYMEPQKLFGQMKDFYESAEESYERSEKQQAAKELLWTACNLLYEKNPKWYYILLDSCMLGMNSIEIGKALDLTPGNVDVMKSRARAYLKAKLKDQYRDFF